MSNGPVMDRLLDRITLDEAGCWRWPGAKNERGYGNIFIVKGKVGRVHRLTYEFFRGPIPEGLTLDHLCRVRECANPWHLEPVPLRENILRGESWSAVNARVTHCRRCGRELAGDNVYLKPRGGRECRACRREHERKRRANIKC